MQTRRLSIFKPAFSFQKHFLSTNNNEIIKDETSSFCKTKSSKSSILITTPLFYVNGAPHIGHLYSALQADALSRWYRLKGLDVKFTTGTDEHGLKVQDAANAEKMPVKAFCDKNATQFKSVFDRADISYDRFLRTTDTDHATSVKAIWETLLKKGYIYMGEHTAWYCKSDESFLTETQVEQRASDTHEVTTTVSKESGHVVERISEMNYKFKLSAFQEPLLNWLQDNPKVIYPSTKLNEVINSIKEGLPDLSVSRLSSKIPWGIAVPSDPEHTIYVWLDALTNYLTVTGYPNMNSVEKFWPADYHILGKDIVKFHAIYWPAFLLAADLPLPKKLVVHGHWLVEGRKMSKSLNNVVNPNALLDQFGIDPVRYFLLRDGSINHDANFSSELFGERFNTELADKLGNLLSRSTASSLLPRHHYPIPGPLIQADIEIQTACNALADRVTEAFEKPDFVHGIGAILEMLHISNRYFTDQTPWHLAKALKNDPNSTEANEVQSRLSTILYFSLESVRIASILLMPIVPKSTAAILDHLKVDCKERTLLYAKIVQSKGQLLNTTTSFLPFPKI